MINKEINDRLVPLLPPPSGGGRQGLSSSSTATALLPISDASMFESPFSCPTILSFSDCRNAVPSDATEPVLLPDPILLRLKLKKIFREKKKVV